MDILEELLRQIYLLKHRLALRAGSNPVLDAICQDWEGEVL